MDALLATVPVATIILVLIVCVPQIVKFVSWILSLAKMHKQNQQASFNAGRRAEQVENKEEERFEAGERRICLLETREDKLEQILLAQQKQIDSLVESDNLEIKHTIKRTWEKVCKFNQPIDAYDLSLLEDRFALYEARGGNSWAHDMMKEIRKKATTTTSIPAHSSSVDSDED